ncbi:MAG: M56 family metallopeptidase [Gemmatimonas sp.]|jgi:TonB-dependent SusC/RagA subfamily outer membrane receptor|uniref:M56 family metallopeptidase n=1 Tax=Gemmatimonas sp. TaxID=1962908 RepID=UPI00391F30F4
MPGLAELAPLVASWMAAAALVSALLAAAALLVQRLVSGTFPVRVIWSVALLFAVGLSFTQPWRRVASSLPVAASVATATTLAAPVATPAPWREGWERAAGFAGMATHGMGVLTYRTSRLTADLARQAPMPVQLALVLLWPTSMLVVGLALAATYRRHRRLVASAEQRTVHDVSVRVSDDLGPLVIGARSAQIIVPRWLLARSDEEQRLVVLHERAHVEARDPLLLLAGCLAAAAMPWNPASWFMLARLRLAIELDCDARLLARGASPRRYGQLLIELSAAPPLRRRLQSAPAFSYRASHLERRLHTMTARPPMFRGPRRTLALVVATAAAVAACGSELPTSAELEGMDVAAATQRLDRIGTPTERRYFIDGRAVSEADAKALPAERLASIEIVKEPRGVQSILLRTSTAPVERAAAPAGSTPVVSMEIRSIDSTATALRVATTAAGLAARADSTGGQVIVRDMVMLRRDGTGDSTRVLLRSGDSTRVLLRSGDSVRWEPAKQKFEGIVMLDGVPADESVMRTLPPDRIERIEVIKGAAAEKLYGPKGAHGAIVITTKK